MERTQSRSERGRCFAQCVSLLKAALKGDWNGAQEILLQDPNLITTPITEGGETALHIAALEGHYPFVNNLGQKIERRHLEIGNYNGCTALCFAAAGGHVRIAELMVSRNRELPVIRARNGVTPLYMAALRGHDKMAGYLYPLSRFESWTPQDQIELLNTAIDSDLYGLAMKIVEENDRTLAVAEDSHGETPLQVLARKPLAYRCSRRQGLCTSLSNTIHERYMRMIMTTQNTYASCDAHALLGCLWDIAIDQQYIERGAGNMVNLFFAAAESGNEEFLVELIRRYPDFQYKVNESKHSILHIAVLKRYEKVFNLMNELGGTKELMATYIDTDGNNILHLVAKLAPQRQLNSIPGAALQMQREVWWYKEVEKLTPPLYRTMKNNAGKTPYDLFLEEHDNLMKAGGKHMKETANSCMLVTMLIATVVFTAAFTVPGGYNNVTGVPILENKRLFMVFPVSEAVATLSSLTSMLMFLSILTSRFSENDFLLCLPFLLVVGVAALFVSIVTMMVTFCTCLLFFQHGGPTITALLVLFAIVPTVFVILKYPLLFAVLRCTYSCSWSFRSHTWLHA